MDRSQEIIRTSWIGIIANVLLAGFKAAVGGIDYQHFLACRFAGIVPLRNEDDVGGPGEVCGRSPAQYSGGYDPKPRDGRADGYPDHGNPYLPLWEHIPDGEPYVFDDPDNPGKQRIFMVRTTT